MLTLHPPAFIETQGCNGPNYTRGQPNRETPGVILTEIQDKYIPEFELPYRNIERYIHEMKNNWNRLNTKQRAAAQESFKAMGMGSLIDNKKEQFTQFNSTIDCAKYIAENPEIRTHDLLSMLWNPTETEKNQLTEGLSSQESKDLLYNLKSSVYNWTTDQSYTLYSNWKSGLLLFFIIILFLFIGIAAGISNR